jgi:hypothetical protein
MYVDLVRPDVDALDQGGKHRTLACSWQLGSALADFRGWTERSQRFPCEMADAQIRDITRVIPDPRSPKGGCKMYECHRFEARPSPDPDALSRTVTHLVGTLPMPSMNRK